MKLKTHLHLVPGSRKRVAIQPLPHTSSWHIDQLIKHMDRYTYLLNIIVDLYTCRRKGSVRRNFRFHIQNMTLWYSSRVFGKSLMTVRFACVREIIDDCSVRVY